MSNKAAFAAAWAKTGRAEGSYVDDPSDSGGVTNWGITEKVARAHGYTGNMRDLFSREAESIAKSAYWDVMNLDKIIATSNVALAFELFDTGFNTGTHRASEFLQRALNALNNEQWRYDDVVVDGDIGRATLNALDEFTTWRGVGGITVLLKALNCLQGAFYIELAERRQKDEKFLYGWLSHRVSL